MTIQRRAFSGIVAGGANFIITFGLTLAQVPLLLHYWGAELYGSWTALFAFYSLLITLDTGHQGYLGAIFLQKVHGQREEVKTALGSGVRMACVLGALQLLMCLLIAIFEWARPVIGADSHVISNTELGFSLAALIVQWVLAGSIGGILVKIFSASGLYTRAMIWGIGYRVLFTASLCGGAMASGRILPAAAAVAVTITIYSFLQAWDLKRLFPDLFPWWSKGSWLEGWRNLRSSTWLTTSGVIQQFSTNGLVLLVTHLLDSVAVALLTTMRTLANTATQATSIVVQPILPDLIRYHVANEGQKVKHTLAGLWFVSGVLVNLGLATAIAVAPPFYQYWTQGKLPFDGVLFGLLAVSILIRNIASPLSVYLYGLNDIGAQMRIAVGQTVSTLLVCALLVSEFGIRGAGLGVICGEIVAAVIAFRYVAKAVVPLGIDLTLGQIVFPSLGLALVAAGYGADALWPGHSLAICLATISALLGLARLNWQNLPDSVRSRISSIMPKAIGLGANSPKI
jgi:O-antigen/teichoic acid export membrane protein